MLKPLKRSIVLLVALALLAAMAVGCGSSDPEGDTPQAQKQFINIATGVPLELISRWEERWRNPEQ